MAFVKIYKCHAVNMETAEKVNKNTRIRLFFTKYITLKCSTVLNILNEPNKKNLKEKLEH